MARLGDVHVVDLKTVTAAELDDLWRHEVRLWRDRLLWDASGAFATLRRLVGRGGLPGKAVLAGGRAVGYTYYGIEGRVAVLAGLAVLPDWSCSAVGGALLRNTIDDMQQRGASRIECRCLAADCPWLGEALEAEGFRTYWREFLRRELGPKHWSERPLTSVSLAPWQGAYLGEAAAILLEAYTGSIEADILSLYRSMDGCRDVLDNIVNQGSCGTLVREASALARIQGRSLGFVVVTEVAPRQGHLPQVAVRPEYQGQGIGRGLLHHSLRQLAVAGYETLSLIVSRANDRARTLYRTMDFHTVLDFPVGIWEREGRGDVGSASDEASPHLRSPPPNSDEGAGEGGGQPRPRPRRMQAKRRSTGKA